MIRSLYKYLLSINLNPLMIIKLLSRIPWFLNQKKNFKKLQKNPKWDLENHPILKDLDAESAILGEYFWQDLFVAKEIIKKNPKRHIDVGSRVDGFIAHLACVRKVEVFDIRPLSSIIENVKFTQWDVTNPTPELNGVSDCVSCLHSLEHIGLGRYGDKLDPDGWKKGLSSLANLLTSSGCLWISVPVGIERVEFNANRVFDPSTIINEGNDIGIKLDRFFYLTKKGFKESAVVQDDIIKLSNQKYGLGIFLFTKNQFN